MPPISPEDKASLIADVDAARAYYNAYLTQKNLSTIAQGGIIGPDYIHPTGAGHVVIARGLLALMKSAAQRSSQCATPAFGGFSAETLDQLYCASLAPAEAFIQQFRGHNTYILTPLMPGA